MIEFFPVVNEKSYKLDGYSFKVERSGTGYGRRYILHFDHPFLLDWSGVFKFDKKRDALKFATWMIQRDVARTTRPKFKHLFSNAI